MRRSAVALLIGLCLGTAACGSGKSILQAGADDEEVAVAPGETPPGDGAVPGGTGPTAPSTPGDGDGSLDGSGDGGQAPGVTAPPPTTVPRPLDSLPACPVDALAAAGGPVEILFWHGLTGLNLDTIVALTEEYNAGQSRVRVQIENQGSYEQVIEKYAQTGDSDRPNLVMFPEYAVQQAIDSESIVPIGACIEASGLDTSAFQPSVLAAYETVGVQWAMPFNVSNPVLYYNKPVFEAAGLDPERPPRSLQELRDMSQQIVDSGAAPFGIALDSDTDGGGGWYLEQWFANAGELYADNGNGRDAPATRVLIDGPAGVEMLSFVQGMVQDGLAVYVGDNPSGQDNLLKMTDKANPSAMALSTSAALGLVTQVLDGGLVEGFSGDDLGIGPLPGPSGTPTALVGGAALYISNSGVDAEIAAAWDYLNFLISPEIQSRWASITGYVPIRGDALTIEPLASKYADDPRYRVAYDQLVGSGDDPALRGPILGPQREVRVATARAVAAIFVGSDVQQALTDAATEANQLIANYNARN